jgi:hypothetical protein
MFLTEYGFRFSDFFVTTKVGGGSLDDNSLKPEYMWQLTWLVNNILNRGKLNRI